jgi:drug/metabolite transporter (DMT)-like permease
MMAGTAILLFAQMIAVRGMAFIGDMRKYWYFALGAGGLALASYAIALWAVTLAPIGLVAALRETSVVFAAILGTLLFGESFGTKRWLALGAIVTGIILLRLSGG